MSSHPFNFEELQWQVYELKYAQDKVDYLEGKYVEISIYLTEHPQAQSDLQPMLNIISGKIEHYRQQAIEDNKQGIRQPYQKKGKGRPRHTRTQAIDQIDAAVEAGSIPPTASTDPDILDYEGAAELLNLKVSTLQKYKSKGKIPAHRTPTGGVIFFRDELLQWLRSGFAPSTEGLATGTDELTKQTEAQKGKHYRPSREQKKEDRKQNIMKWTSKEVEEMYRDMKRRKSRS